MPWNPEGSGIASRSMAGWKQQGILVESYPLAAADTALAPATQVVFGALMGLNQGDVVTGILLRSSVAAAGTLPTTVRSGIANAAGTMLAISGNLNAVANWPQGAVALPLAAPYAVPVTGGYYACFVVNGIWGTTQPTPVRGNSTNNVSGAFGSNAPPFFGWSGQTDLPAVGSPLTLTAAGIAYYMAFY